MGSTKVVIFITLRLLLHNFRDYSTSMKKIPSVLLLLVMVPLLVAARADTYKITITAATYAAEITDAQALRDFRFGGGPGNTLNGAPNWKPKSWIVEDWTQSVAEPDRTLPRFRASFQLQMNNGAMREYIVHYVYDSAARQGYIYLPGRGDASYSENVYTLYRGDRFEGHASGFFRDFLDPIPYG